MVASSDTASRYLAGYFPTQRFTLAEIKAMPRCFGPEWEGAYGPDGYSLWKDSTGRLIVCFVPTDSMTGAYGVRPIIRVPAVTG